MAFTYVRFHKAMRVQGISKADYLPEVSPLQPWCGYWAAFWAPLFVLVQGYSVFLEGNWETSTFIFNYGILALAGGVGLAWKFAKRTRFYRAHEIDLATDVEFFNELDNYYQHKRDDEGPGNLKKRIIDRVF